MELIPESATGFLAFIQTKLGHPDDLRMETAGPVSVVFLASLTKKSALHNNIISPIKQLIAKKKRIPVGGITRADPGNRLSPARYLLRLNPGFA